ncbi:formate dehydrogenase accessory sulfurtransferase FdhD [Lysobacter sp. S4-A87]|uniref:formate dehydrogenase accessory sulfurtransferase FdhD n=1 Tax=Lysobacter sp. S4-A87 TaxID=2925843 RepID=UPI001F53D176|nr:formate dehydrogenase accessory sulfurtransferase FdhD [Lysobacter sp. S4-A87]UNK49284.1 formate dehydrogenase accessory sulfurtransferase FdhD [Lysobacter sp. S4-A87]
MSGPLSDVQALRLHGDARTQHDDRVIVEAPVALLYNGEPFVVMMATPESLPDFALGFALSEGIVASAAEFRLVDVVRHDEGVALHAAIPQARFDALQDRRRGLEGRSGCGLCGVESLQAALRPVPRVTAPTPVSAATIHAALAALAEQQPLNLLSGGVHAAGFAHGDGLLVREDVGRHNALDKLVGAMAAQEPPLRARDGFLVITSRASYEIVHKAATAGIALVVAISAPTDLAIRTADAAGITLAAFARGGQLNVYTHSEGIAAGA